MATTAELVQFNPQIHSRTMPKARNSGSNPNTGSGLDFSNRRMNRDFSLSGSNGERQRGDTEVSVSYVVPFVGTLRCSNWAGARYRIPRNTDSFPQDLHPDLKADLVPVRKDLARM